MENNDDLKFSYYDCIDLWYTLQSLKYIARRTATEYEKDAVKCDSMNFFANNAEMFEKRLRRFLDGFKD